MVEPSGWHCHRFATEKRFTQVTFYFLILTQNDRKVRKGEAVSNCAWLVAWIATFLLEFVDITK